MGIHQLEFQLSPALTRELAYFSETEDSRKIYSTLRTREEVLSWIETNPDYVDLQGFPAAFPRGSLLDVGVGLGLTSAYLAIRGFTVTSLDPSLESCLGLEGFFKALDLRASIYRGTAESMDQIPEVFDGVVFWSSLHHCDDPHRALKNAYQKLRPGGWVVLCEPVLRFYRTQKWFYRMMEVDPRKIGHYGGNEHIYRSGDYRDFLRRAGFTLVSSVPSQKYTLSPKRASWDNDARWRVKTLYYRAVRRIATRNNGLSRLLIALSLLTPVTVARKA
jgi:SAM-dependent methyltransferase